ncbi:MAG: homoserine kinase [Candidatus Thermoplasmatota archaeon]|jgi:homoserine kinase|nr:homoserine kinase [Candidatus Thermoplasmatota archaeon]
MKECTAVSFSSSANLGPGFDTVAIAHTAFHDRVRVSALGGANHGEIEVECRGIQGDADSNTAGRAAKAMYRELELMENMKITIEKGIPEGLGMGSSGSSAAAAVKAIDFSLGLGLSREDLVKFATEGEAASSGTPHSDNVAASISGGLVFLGSTDPMKIHKFEIAKNLGILLIIPAIKMKQKTRVAREAVPKMITMGDHIVGSRRLSLLLQGLQSGDRDIIKENMQDDIVERSRMHMFPFYEEIKKRSLENGAVGVSVSGAGPSIIEFTDSLTDTGKIVSRVSEIFGSLQTEVSFSMCKAAGGAYIE